MLRADSGTVEIEGRKLQLMSEFTQMVNRLMKCGAFTEDDIDLCIKTAKKSDEELAAEARELTDKYGLDADMIKTLMDILL